MTDYVQAPFGIFELRPGRPPVLHQKGTTSYYGPTGHDYTTEEVRAWTAYSPKWNYISAQEAKELISK